mgnify:CR=1 FL=1
MWIKYSASVPESADSTSDCTPDFEPLADLLEQSAWSRGKPLASASWEKRLKKGGWTTLLSGAEICETYPQTNFRPSTGSQVATLASPSRNQAKDKATKTQDTSGLQFSILFGNYDHPACCLKTSLDTSRWGCSMSCPTWIVSVTERRGAFIRRRLAEPLTKGNESSSLEWPTPTAIMRPQEGNVRKMRLAVEAGMDRDQADIIAGKNIEEPHGKLKAWPTPTSRDHKDGTATYDVPTNGYLGRAAPRDPTSLPGRLNPDWVEELMGFPTGWTDCER